MVIETSALLLLALLLLTVPVNWLLAFFAAAAVHELFHYLALRLLGGQAHGFAVGGAGAVLTVSGLGPGREALCALAGPLGALFLLPCYPWFPRLALCAAIHSAFNLLPIRPLDGGRALYGVLCLFLPEAAAQSCQRIAEKIFLCMLIGICLSLKMGMIPLVFALLCILKALSRKIPCKLPLPGVQ